MSKSESERESANESESESESESERGHISIYVEKINFKYEIVKFLGVILINV